MTNGQVFGSCYTKDGTEIHYFGGGPKCQCGKRDAVQSAEPARPDLRLIEGGSEGKPDGEAA